MTVERRPMPAGMGARPEARAVRGPIDYLILGVTILLTLFGLVMVFSASFYKSQAQGGEGSYYLVKQLFGAGIGILALVVACNIPYRFYGKPVVPFFLMMLSAVLLVIVLFADKKNEVNRFLTIGSVQFQPSEIARFSLIVFISWWISGHTADIREKNLKKFLTRGIGVPLCATAVITSLILLGRNLSMAVSTLLIAVVLLLVAGVNWKRFAVMLTACGAFGLIFTVTEAYRAKRLFIFLDPWKDAAKDGYQIIQSLYSLGSGGLFGVGLGNSRQKLLYLPYAESDFILSIVGEELGFVGMALLLLLFWVLIWRGLLVASKAPDNFGMLMAAGITSLIGVQVLINVLVVTSSMPPTGVPLPFISHGSTSLVVFMTAVGILLNISRRQLRT
jgi:cell division protein FtsW